jgi:hypothetical protein
MQKSFWVHIIKILYKSLKSLDKLNIVEKVKRLAIAKVLILINNFDFLKILLNSIVEAIF